MSESSGSWHWPTLIVCHVLAVALFLSWWLLPNHGFWFPLDRGVFYFFNDMLPEHPDYAYFVAIINRHSFDLMCGAAMGVIYMVAVWKAEPGTRSRMMVNLLLLFLFSTVLFRKVGDVIEFDIRSPTLVFDDSVEVSELLGVEAKDTSRNAFPSDHGIVLYTFLAYVLVYLPRRYGVIALVTALLISMPRMMSGAHWLTDYICGSLPLVLVGCSWLLATPLNDRLASFLLRTVFRQKATSGG